MRDATAKRVVRPTRMARAKPRGSPIGGPQFALDWLDQSEDYGEDRFATIGMAEGRLLYVAYTIRGERIRILSARMREPFERRRCHEENNE